MISELLDREWERRVEEISRTRRIKSRDVLTITTLTLNREVGEVAHEVEMLRTAVGVLAKEVEGLRKEVEGLKTEVDILAGEVRERSRENSTKKEVTGLRELHKPERGVWKRIVGLSALVIILSILSILYI